MELLKGVAEQLAENDLLVRSKKIVLPDEDMEYKISHKFEFGLISYRFQLNGLIVLNKVIKFDRLLTSFPQDTSRI